MKYKILGSIFTREGFEINPSYRGIYRNELPSPKNEEIAKSDFLNNLYITFSLDDSSQGAPVSLLLEVTDCMKNLATESFELILIKGIEEEVPQNILYKKLGYEVIASNGYSMIHFWLRKREKEFGFLHDVYVKKMNNHYLFSCIEDAQFFIEAIIPYSNLVTSHFQLDYKIIEIIQIESTIK